MRLCGFGGFVCVETGLNLRVRNRVCRLLCAQVGDGGREGVTGLRREQPMLAAPCFERLEGGLRIAVALKDMPRNVAVDACACDLFKDRGAFIGLGAQKGVKVALGQ